MKSVNKSGLYQVKLTFNNPVLKQYMLKILTFIKHFEMWISKQKWVSSGEKIFDIQETRKMKLRNHSCEIHEKNHEKHHEKSWNSWNSWNNHEIHETREIHETHHEKKREIHETNHEKIMVPSFYTSVSPSFTVWLSVSCRTGLQFHQQKLGHFEKPTKSAMGSWWFFGFFSGWLNDPF